MTDKSGGTEWTSGNTASPVNLGIPPETLVEVYRVMSRIQAVDKAVIAGISAGRFQFSYWPMRGQENIPATLAQMTTTDDYMVTTYRGIHDQVAKGVSLYGLFCEMLGRADGLNKGKGGSPHISDPSSGSMLTTAIVGAGAPIANGLALAAMLRDEKRVTVVNFGDGATSIGAVHEAMNLASLWRLPVIFMCQNNQFGEYTRVKDYTASKSLAARADALGFRGVTLDGNDPVEFYRGMQEVVESVRNGGGPVFVEAQTYRIGCHAGIGDNNNATADELAAARERAPLVRAQELLLNAGICDEAALAAIQAEVQAEVNDALEKAMAAQTTPVDTRISDVFADDDAVPRAGHYPFREAEVLPEGPTEKITLLDAIQRAQDTAMACDSSVILLGEDVGEPHGGVFGTNKDLQTKYGKSRVRPTPIAEQAIIGACIGSALVGMRPIAEIMFIDFMGVCLDQVANHAAKQRYMSGSATHVPMTIRAPVGGGQGFGAQHSQSLEAWLLHTPGLKVAYPSTPADAKGLLLSAIFDDDPCVVLESIMLMRAKKGEVPTADYRIPFGVAKTRREGTDITLVTYGWQVNQCLAAAEELAKEGISAEVIDLRSLMPIDYHRVLESARKTGRLLIVHAAVEFCGLGAEIASTVNQELWRELKAPAQRFGADYAPIAYASELERNQAPYSDTIASRVRAMLKS